jgi:hypothetical protein
MEEMFCGFVHHLRLQTHKVLEHVSVDIWGGGGHSITTSSKIPARGDSVCHIATRRWRKFHFPICFENVNLRIFDSHQNIGQIYNYRISSGTLGTGLQRKYFRIIKNLLN